MDKPEKKKKNLLLNFVIKATKRKFAKDFGEDAELAMLAWAKVVTPQEEHARIDYMKKADPSEYMQLIAGSMLWQPKAYQNFKKYVYRDD